MLKNAASDHGMAAGKFFVSVSVWFLTVVVTLKMQTVLELKLVAGYMLMLFFECNDASTWNSAKHLAQCHVACHLNSSEMLPTRMGIHHLPDCWVGDPESLRQRYLIMS